MNDLVELNLELAIAYLDDCIRDLHECVEKLDKALGNVKDMKDATKRQP